MKKFSAENQRIIQQNYNALQHLRFYKRILIDLRRATFTSENKVTVSSLRSHLDKLSHDNAKRIVAKLEALGYTVKVVQAKEENYVIEISW